MTLSSMPTSLTASDPLQHRNGVGGMSCGKFSGKAEALTYRQFFAKRWQQFVIENFESPAHAAAVFRVNSTTAENWWQGLNAPQGWVVGRAVTDPELSQKAIEHLSGGSTCGRFAAE